jgi:hypothetical protein
MAGVQHLITSCNCVAPLHGAARRCTTRHDSALRSAPRSNATFHLSITRRTAAHRGTVPRSARHRHTAHLSATQRFLYQFTRRTVPRHYALRRRAARHIAQQRNATIHLSIYPARRRPATHRNSTQRATALRSALHLHAPQLNATVHLSIYSPHRHARRRSATQRIATPHTASHRNATILTRRTIDMLFQRSETTDRLVRYLQHHDKGSLLNYAELTAHAGEPITSRSPKLISAIRVLERDHAQVWNLVKPHIGVYRFKDDELATRLRKWWMRGARRKLIRGGSQSEIVDNRTLDADQQTAFSVDCVQRELAFQSLSRATRNRLEKVSRGSSNDLPSFNILEWAVSLSPRGK